MVHKGRLCSWTQRELKGECVARWRSEHPFHKFPAAFKGNRETKRFTAHIDVKMPYSRRAWRIWSTKRSKNENGPLACLPLIQRKWGFPRTRSKLFLPIGTRKYPGAIWKYFIQEDQDGNLIGRPSSILILRILNFTIWRRIPMSFRILHASETLKAFWKCKNPN